MPKTFKDLVKQSEGFKAFSTDTYTSKDYTMIPINQICCRSVNKYVDKQDVAESLKNSIKKLGLIEPIIVIEIASYKKKLSEEDQDYAYLTRMEEKGCRYFISSGHRRFKAFISIALKRDMYPGNQIDYLYSDEVKKKIQEFYFERENGFPDGGKPEYRFYEIPCKVEKKLIENENEFYNQSNSTQRELTNYEVIINAIDSLEKSGAMDQFKNNAVETVINGLSPRSLSEWLNAYVKEGLLEKETVKNLNDDEDRRNLLKTVPSDNISKTKALIAQQISDAILEESGRKITAKKISETMAMLEELEKLEAKTDYNIMGLVYAGEMNFNEAMELSRMSDRFNSKSEKEDFYKLLVEPINEARENNQEIGRLKDSDAEKYTSLEYTRIVDVSKKCLKTLKDKYIKKKEDKKISFTNAELIEFIYAIDRGDTTAREVIDKIERLNRR